MILSGTAWVALAFGLVGCNKDPVEGKDPPPVDEVYPDPAIGAAGPGEDVPGRECDAGDESWVARTMPLVWGRKAHGAQEIAYWSQMAATHGRDAVVRAMTQDVQYYVNWHDWFTDALYVARTGDKEYADCFAEPELGQWDGTLTAWLQTRGPTDGAFGPTFNMADVIVDALVADDVSVIYRAHLFARMNKPVQGANVSQDQLEYNRRVNFGELFYRTYLGRSLNCMVCHNSEFSTTDHPDPHLDRTWQVPGKFETALLASPTGRDVQEAYSIFRYDAVTPGGFSSGLRPWGIDRACGDFVGPDAISGNDMLGQQISWFIEDLGPTGTMYDVERDLALGVDALDGAGLAVGSGGEDGGPEAFAYLLAMNLASQVWAAGTGAELVVAHWFPRNEGQQVRLQALADLLVERRFSMRELLVAITTDPYFNQGLPQSCFAVAYGLDPVFDPWTISDDDPHRRRNGASDMTHRLPARALLRTATANLGWVSRDAFFETNFFGQSDNPEEEAFQSAVGVFLRESDPGHRGTDFQGLLAFETELGSCSARKIGGSDYVDRLLSEALAEGATVGDVAAALKDRLVPEPIGPEEQALVEALVERTFADPVDDSPELEARIRLWCGTLLLSPQFQLVTDPPPPGAPPTLGSDARADCQRIATLMTRAGTDVTCEGTRLE